MRSEVIIKKEMEFHTRLVYLIHESTPKPNDSPSQEKYLSG